MTFYVDERPHPMGLLENPEWAASRRVRAELYLAERERRNAVDYEPNRFGLAVVIIAALAVACALLGSLL
jgi:hypothetical protein